MANFFTDNEDIKFLFDHINMAELADIQESGFSKPDASGYAPRDAADAVDNYRRILTIVGQIAAEQIAPRSEAVDQDGNVLNADGTVTLGENVRENLKVLAQADLMGFTLPRKYGGLNCPTTVYTMANEIISRADCSLMNLFGLQGIAETIYAFADDKVRDEYLPKFATGEVTGAMVLTEPDAGSDLQAVQLRAWQDEDGQWRLTGVKRFITNGCGEVLLVLARSEPGTTDGRGLSMFLAERGPRIRVRHLEEKLGIHGSPTCELVFDDTPAKLIGERQLGLIRYVFSLMNGARLGIASQSLGVAESAYRLARTYAHSRKQFGVSIERLPAVAELVTDMKIHIEAARALTYETARVCDLENNNLRVIEFETPKDPAELKRRKETARTLKRLNGMLTPMSKYYSSEMCVKVASDAIQVLGGSGYIKDYPAERYLRDARITTIYEGTSQLQVVAAVRGVCSGAFEKRVEELEKDVYTDPMLKALQAKLAEGKALVQKGIAVVKEKGTEYTDLFGRKMVDSAITVLVGHFLLQQAAKNDRKKSVARRFIDSRMADLRRDIDLVCSGDTSPLSEYDLLAGPVPSTR
jgi:alkylation response protein AidB-like acyl-CoA dehydrogenase